MHKRVSLGGLLHLPLKGGGGFVMNCLIGADQIMLERAVKTSFLGEVESTVRLGIKHGFGGMAWPK